MIKNQITDALTAALKNQDKSRLSVLRFVLSGIKYAEIEKKGDLTDAETVNLLRKEVKKRRESIELFKKGNRQDLVTEEEKQVNIILEYLPKEMSPEELDKIVDEVLAETSDKSNMGKIIGAVMAKTKGQADGAAVASLVRGKLKT